jgi:hypothetical protein
MFEELKKLIQESVTLSAIEKQLWIETAKHLDDTKRGQLKEILLKEKEEFTKIQSEYCSRSTIVNGKHLEEIKQLVVVERKKAVAQDEKKEAEQTDKILDKIKTL